MLLNDYLDHLHARGRADGTVRRRIADIEHLQLECPDLLQVQFEDLERNLARMSRAGLGAEARKNRQASFRVFYDWAYRTGRMSWDPAFYLEPIPIPTTVARIAPDDAIQSSLIAASLEHRSMILLGRLACLRLSELTTLRLRDRQHDALRVTGKGDKQRLIYINDQLMDVLLLREREVLGVSDYYFPGRYGGHMHPQSVNKIITRVTGWNPHSLRHAGATAAFKATRDIRAVSEMLGHASIAVTQRYLHLNEDARRAAAAGTAFGASVSSPHWPQFGERVDQTIGIAA